MQLGHAGAKGSTRPMWDGIDLPLEHGNWPLVSSSPQQYLAGVSQVAREASLADLERIKHDFVRAAEAAHEAGFDWLELHCAHGYLLSSFSGGAALNMRAEYLLMSIAVVVIGGSSIAYTARRGRSARAAGLHRRAPG